MRSSKNSKNFMEFEPYQTRPYMWHKKSSHLLSKPTFLIHLVVDDCLWFRKFGMQKGTQKVACIPSRPHESFRKETMLTRMDRMWLRCHGILGGEVHGCPAAQVEKAKGGTHRRQKKELSYTRLCGNNERSSVRVAARGQSCEINRVKLIYSAFSGHRGSDMQLWHVGRAIKF